MERVNDTRRQENGNPDSNRSTESTEGNFAHAGSVGLTRRRRAALPEQEIAAFGGATSNWPPGDGFIAAEWRPTRSSRCLARPEAMRLAGPPPRQHVELCETSWARSPSLSQLHGKSREDCRAEQAGARRGSASPPGRARRPSCGRDRRLNLIRATTPPRRASCSSRVLSDRARVPERSIRYREAQAGWLHRAVRPVVRR